MYDDVRRSDVLMYSEEAEVLKESHILVSGGVVRSKHDVVDDVWHHETLRIINIHKLGLLFIHCELKSSPAVAERPRDASCH